MKKLMSTYKLYFLVFFLYSSFLFSQLSSTDYLIEMEQTRINRSVDTSLIMSPTTEGQQEFYRPENRNWFAIKSVWVPEDELYVAEAKELFPKDLRKYFTKDENGKIYYKLLIHPESEQLYKKITDKYPSFIEFEATSTSSSRTVLIRSKENKQISFFGKLSLDVNLGGVVRTVPKGEVSRSVGVAEYVSKVQHKLDSNYQMMPDVFGINPKSMQRGGMLIRPIPEAVKDSTIRLVPLFSLYADHAEGTLLKKLAEESKLSPREFVKKKILEPFHKAWVSWAVNGPIVMEAHAQNVLAELDSEGKMTGRFFHRDMGGFNIDMNSPHFDQKNRKDMIVFDDLEEEYHLKFSKKAQIQSYNIYFEGGFLYNVDKELIKIDPNYTKGDIYKTSRNIFVKNLALYSHLGTKGSFQDTTIRKHLDTIDNISASDNKNLNSKTAGTFSRIQTCLLQIGSFSK